MANVNQYWKRLESVIGWSNMTTNAFGRHIGLVRSESLYQIKAGRFGISSALAQRIVAKFPQISLGWLLSGEGEMLSAASVAQPIPYYDLDVAAVKDLHSGNLSVTGILSLPVVESCDCAFRTFDNAMGEQIMAGSIVFLKKTDLNAIIPCRNYVIVTANYVILRKLRVIKEDSAIRYHLEAEQQGYDAIVLEPKEVVSLYRVVASLKMY